MKERIEKQFEITQEDGWWIASTPAVDRQDDRVFPMGLDLSNYMKNPVLLWAHDYYSPFAVIGKTSDVQLNDNSFRIKPEWREPANDNDPMTIIRSLIDAGLVRALSIGFRPLEWKDNDAGGYDFTKAEILEVSVVPVPANQEALRLAVKALQPTERNDTRKSQEPPAPDDAATERPENNSADTELSPEAKAALEQLLETIESEISAIKQEYER